MKNWFHFAASAPDLAEIGVKRLSDRLAYLATISQDGAPRVHPVVPHIADGSLFVYMNPTSPKVQDLARDNRYALHCSVEDSSGGAGEFSVRGGAILVEENQRRSRLVEAAKANGFHPKDNYVVFELNIHSVLSITYEGELPIRKRWQDN